MTIWTTPASSFLCVWNMIQTDINIIILYYMDSYGQYQWWISHLPSTNPPVSVSKLFPSHQPGPTQRCSTTASPTWENPRWESPKDPWCPKWMFPMMCLKAEKRQDMSCMLQPLMFFHPHIFFHMFKVPKPRVLSQAWPLIFGRASRCHSWKHPAAPTSEWRSPGSSQEWNLDDSTRGNGDHHPVNFKAARIYHVSIYNNNLSIYI